MFIRWKESRDPSYHVTRCSAYLVQSVRIDGKPRQIQHYLAAYSEYDPDWLRYQTKLAQDEHERRFRFWYQAGVKLARIDSLSHDDRTRLIKKLGERVPITLFRNRS
jgi:hypothetical protein